MRAIVPLLLAVSLAASTVESEADRYFREGKFAEAAAAYRLALGSDPNSADALSGLGRSLLELSRPAEAVQYLGKAFQTQPENADLKRWLAKALLRAGNPGAAIGLLEPVVTPETKDPEAVLLLGEAMYLGGYYQRSLQLLEQGLALGPGNAAATRMRAVALAKVGRTEEASRALKEILKDSPGPADLDVLLTYVELLAEGGRAGEALPQADRALKEQPANPIAHFWKARLLLQMGQLDGAAGEAEKSVALAPQLPFARNLLVQIYRKTGRVDEAKAQAEWLREFNDRQAGRGRL
jgi:tetratricopeptide (TPR) repeat protein